VARREVLNDPSPSWWARTGHPDLRSRQAAQAHPRGRAERRVRAQATPGAGPGLLWHPARSLGRGRARLVRCGARGHARDAGRYLARHAGAGLFGGTCPPVVPLEPPGP